MIEVHEPRNKGHLLIYGSNQHYEGVIKTLGQFRSGRQTEIAYPDEMSSAVAISGSKFEFKLHFPSF